MPFRSRQSVPVTFFAAWNIFTVFWVWPKWSRYQQNGAIHVNTESGNSHCLGLLPNLVSEIPGIVGKGVERWIQNQIYGGTRDKKTTCAKLIPSEISRPY
jgi:hypothetical protein